MPPSGRSGAARLLNGYALGLFMKPARLSRAMTGMTDMTALPASFLSRLDLAWR